MLNFFYVKICFFTLEAEQNDTNMIKIESLVWALQAILSSITRWRSGEVSTNKLAVAWKP